jgi:hypothetical protein
MRAKPELLSRLREKSHIGQSVIFKDKASGEGKSLGTVEDEVSIILGEGSGDVYKHLIQRIKRSEKAWDGSQYEYRGGYFTLDGKKTRIVWGQLRTVPNREGISTAASKSARKARDFCG